MLLPFRQGIVQCEAEGFLVVNLSSVSLVVNDTPTVITMAKGTTNYLHVEHHSYTAAWQITPGVDQWLYWDIHPFTAVRTFGVTTVLPIVSSTEPTSPVEDQHWFDTFGKVMKVWQSNHWTEKLRVFACKLTGGSAISSVSINSPAFSGTQVGLVENSKAGVILFDSVTGKPLRAGDKFITTEDVIATTPLTKSDVKVEATFIQGEAQVPLAKYTAVYFSEFGKISYITPVQMSGTYVPVGIVQNDCVAGDITTVTMSGVITVAEWNWSFVGVNQPIYCNTSGELTSTSLYPNQRPVGYVVDTHSLLVGMVSLNVTGTSETAVTDLDGLTDVTITTPTPSQQLVFNGSQWVNSTVSPPIYALDGLSDVVLDTPIDGNSLVFSGTNWINITPKSVNVLDDLGDVAITTATTDNYLRFDGTSWVNTAFPVLPTDLNDLTDVTLTAPALDDVLTFDGTSWVNTVPVSGGSGTVTYDATSFNLVGPALASSIPVTATSNVLFGNTVYSMALGDENVAIGVAALSANTDGASNTAVGFGALSSNATGEGNVATGTNALFSNTTGFNNSATGYNALYSNTTGNDNIATGYNALYSNTTGSENVAIGNSSMESDVGGFGNTAVGHWTLKTNTYGAYNTAIGSLALQNTTASDNTAVGSYALRSTTTGQQNTAVGSFAMSDNIAGYENTSVGCYSLQRNTSGYDNTMVGFQSGRFITNGYMNTCTGATSGRSLTTGYQNTATGYRAMVSAADAHQNVAVGTDALAALTDGYENVAIGFQSMMTSEFVINNTAVGSSTLKLNTTGEANTALGSYAMFSNTIGVQNTAVGAGALTNNTSGGYNTAIGRDAMYNNTTGEHNTVIGWGAGSNLTTGTNNVLIGGYTGIAGMDNNIVLSNGDGTIRLQHNGTNWKTDSPVTTQVTNLGNITGAVSANATTSDFYYGTVTGITTWTFNGTLTSGTLYSMTLELTNPGAFAQTWPASVKWSNGTLPSLTAAGVDVLEFYTRDGGTTWRGFQSGKDMK